MLLTADAAEPLARFATLRTHDVAEAEHVVSDAYVPHRLVAGAGLDARLNVARSGGITLGWLRYGAEATLAAPPMADTFHLNLTLSGTTTARQHRAEARTTAGRSGAMLAPARPSVVEWSADAGQFALKIERQALEAQLSALLHDAVSRPLRFALAIDLETPEGAALLNGTQFMAAQLALQELADDLVRQQLESFLLTQVLLGVPNSYSHRLTRTAGPIARFALDEAIDYIEAHPDRPLGLAELAAVAGTSATALREAFRRELDTTPGAYVRAVRLARAHAELTDPASEVVSLAALAARWGFPDAERFAWTYRSRYGADPVLPA